MVVFFNSLVIRRSAWYDAVLALSTGFTLSKGHLFLWNEEWKWIQHAYPYTWVVYIMYVYFFYIFLIHFVHGELLQQVKSIKSVCLILFHLSQWLIIFSSHPLPPPPTRTQLTLCITLMYTFYLTSLNYRVLLNRFKYSVNLCTFQHKLYSRFSSCSCWDSHCEDARRKTPYELVYFLVIRKQSLTTEATRLL